MHYLRALRKDAIPDTGAIPFIASTEGQKRDGLDVDSQGWKLDNYKRNPVVLVAHNYWSLPVGRADVRVEDKQLLADITFDPGDELAQQVERKYRTGFLHAISVGFDIMGFAEGGNGRTAEQELLDISAVAVPGDPDALKRMAQRGLASDLTDLLAKLSDEPQQAADVSEYVWPGVALRMAQLYLDTDEDDTEREPRYRAYVRQYRELGKEPPEWMTRSQLSLLDVPLIRGLFGAGEGELLGWDKEPVAPVAVSHEDAERAFLARFMPTAEPETDFLRRLVG